MEQLSSEIDKNDGEVNIPKQSSPPMARHEIVDQDSTFDFKTKTWASDFILVVEEKRLYVSKAVLGVASPVFRKMFQSEFKESIAVEMELPGKRYADVLEFLQCIYPNVNKPISYENVLQLLPLIEEYQMFHRKPECEMVLLKTLNRYGSAENIFALLKEAELYHLDNLMDKSLQLSTSISTEDLEKAKAGFVLSPDLWMKVLKKKYGSIEMENATLKEREFERDVLMSFCRKQTKMSHAKSFTKDFNWKDVSAVLMIETEILFNGAIVKTIQCWNNDLFVSVFVRDRVFSGSMLAIKIQKSISSKCFLYAEIVIVNRFGTDQGKTFWIGENIKPSFDNKTLDADLVRWAEIDQSDYYADGKLYVIIHIFMSEPVTIAS